MAIIRSSILLFLIFGTASQLFAGGNQSKSRSSYYKQRQTYRQHGSTGVCSLASHARARGLDPRTYIRTDFNSSYAEAKAPLTQAGVEVMRKGQNNFYGTNDPIPDQTMQNEAGPQGFGTGVARNGFSQPMLAHAGVLDLTAGQIYQLGPAQISGGNGHSVAYIYHAGKNRYTVHDSFTGIAHTVDSSSFHDAFKGVQGAP